MKNFTNLLNSAAIVSDLKDKTIPLKKYLINQVKNLKPNETTSPPPPAKAPAKKAPAKKAPAPKHQLDLTTVNFSKKIPFIIHSGESADAGANQLRPWLPIFLEAHPDFLVIVRNEPLFKWMKAEFPTVQTAYAKSASDVESVLKLLPSAEYVFYPSSTGNNIHLVRFNHLKHVFIGHGDSDKQSSAHKALRLYDEIWTAGQAHIDRFKNMNFDTAHLSFLKVGRPGLTHIVQAAKNKTYRDLPNKILYLPTWEGVIEDTNYSSTHHSGLIIQQIAEKFNTTTDVKYHPFTGNRNASLKEINQLTKDMVSEQKLTTEVVSKETNISQIINNYNMFICDISGVVTECLAANRPIFVYIPTDRPIIIANSNMSFEEYCYTYSSLDELIEKMEVVLNGNDYLAKNRTRAVNYFLSYRETLDNHFVEQLKYIAQHNKPQFISQLFEDL